MPRLFVYGTLMTGIYNHASLENSIFIGSGITVDKFSLHVSGTIPFLHDDSRDYQVLGELYEVESKVLGEIDFLESNLDWYTREEIDVNVDGKIYTAWIYVNNEEAVKLDHGDFKLYINRITREFYST